MYGCSSKDAANQTTIMIGGKKSSKIMGGGDRGIGASSERSINGHIDKI